MSQRNQLKPRDFGIPMTRVGTPAPRRVLPFPPSQMSPPLPSVPFNFQLLTSNPRLSNSKLGRLAPISSPRKQTTSPFPNSQLVAFFSPIFVPFRNRAGTAPLEPSRGTSQIHRRPSLASFLATSHSPLTTEFLSATFPRLRFELTDCNQRESQFSSSNKNALFHRLSLLAPQFPPADSLTGWRIRARKRDHPYPARR